MKALQGFTVWTVVVFCCLFEISQGSTCNNCSSTLGLSVTTTSIKTPEENCNLTVNEKSYQSHVPNLDPGGVYTVYSQCFNCCLIATEPEKVSILTINSTTSSLSLNWDKPNGTVSNYYVEWTGGSTNGNKTTSNTAEEISGLASGGQYSVTVTAVAGDGHTKGKGFTKSIYTKPEQIRNLTVTEVTTSSMTLNWTRPEGHSSFYIVQWTSSDGSKTANVTEPSTVITGLTAGMEYNITVTAVAGDHETKGDGVSEVQYTRPMMPADVTVNYRDTSSLNISWTLPAGRVDHYEVQLNHIKKQTDKTMVQFSGLLPGQLYTVNILAVAGNFSNSSESEFATYPMPPQSVNITGRTVSSLDLSWDVDPKMQDAPNINYKISYEGVNLISTVRNVTLPQLQSGYYYDITVKTVGPQNLHSTGVNISACTNPNPVLHLQAFPESTTSLKVEWSYPSDHKQNYSYSIFIYNATRNLIRNESLQGNSTSLPELEPGTKYIIAVTTRLTEECQSTKEEVSKYTKPAAVTITEISGSTSNLTVSWDKAEGGVDNYTVILSNITGPAQTMGPLSNSISSTTFTGLKPGVLYCATVVTNSGPLQTNSNKSCNATFPNPPRNIVVKSQTERSILFSWDDPEEMQPDQKFKVTTSNGDDTETKNKTYELKDLEPGRSYSISVATVGVNDYMSEMVSKEASTKPAAVNIAEISGSTTNLTVSWDKAEGGVDNYTVILSNITGPVETMGPLRNSTSSTTFTGLKPGVLYCTIVVTNSGPLQTNSNKSCNATLPNPPRNLHVSLQTVQSLNFTWNRPEDMQPDQYTFIVVINDTPKTQNSTEITEQKLESGSPYTITVVTVGVNSLQSQKVTTTAYTRPYPVTDLQQTEITPDSVTLWWNQTDYRPNYTHVVEVSDISGLISPPDNVTDLTYKARGLNSGTNYSFTVTTLTADGTAASAETVSYFTRPYGITNLVADTLNTTCISLTWTHPLEYKPEYRYVVQTSGCSKTFDKPAISNNTEFTGLNPGTNCSFCVTVIAENGIESVASCTSAYTMPEKVVPHISSQGLNNSMLFSWTKPRGNVDFYRVYLHGTTWTYVELEPTVQSYVFRNLSAGRNYTAVVETHSGNFSAPSESVTNATFPNPPGVIDVLNKTTDSIHVGWAEAPQMAGAQFYYQVEISTNKVDSTTQTNYAFGELESGTSYNVTVTTVAAMGFKSETVRHYMITTTPFPVKNLQAEPTVESVVLTWENPDQYKDSYRFKVLDSNGKSATTKQLSHTMLGLDAGSSYWFTVTTETSDGTTGKTVNITKCTNASPVTSINCKAPNKPNATITWTWERAQGRFSSFLVQFQEAPGTVESCCNFVKGDLMHYSNYTVNVRTQSCGRPSAPVSRTCQTGITDPPVPTNYKSMLQHDVTCHQFSIILSRSLLNNINGPVQHVGVLVTETAPGSLGVDKPDMGVYLESTYDTWKKKKTNAYLATVIDVKDVNVKTRNTEPLIIHVGDETTWYSYGNGILEPTKEYNYAIVLFTSLAMNDQGIISPLSSLFSYTQFDNTVKLPQDPVIIGMAVGVTLGIFSVLLIVLIGFIIYWRRLSKKESSDIQIHSLRANVNFPVKVEDYELYYKKQKADSNCGFAGEYEDLKVVGTAQSKTNALTPENKPKNRYNNVLPYDASRVKLSIIHGNPLDDYINANYIPGYNSKKEFIAAQGPLPATVNDFWRMIWEKNVHTVVMLTRCNEQGRVKCEQYWMPGTKHYGNITVTTTSEISLEDWTIRDFDVKNVKTAETRSVRHFHFTAWPDHGVPETTELLISFRHLVREHMDQYRHSPTVVHCSAGVGRTGTFIAIDRLIFQIERENVVDVYGIVHDMRMHRGLMVQTEDQYVFLNQCALDVIRSRTGNNVDLIYQNMAAFAIYENVESIELQQRNEK